MTSTDQAPVAVIPAPRPGSAPRPPARWPPTATAWRCSPAASTGSPRWPPSSATAPWPSRPTSPTATPYAETRQGTEQLYGQVEVTAEDVAEVIAFVLSRPRRLAIHELLLRPAGQEL